MILTAHQPVYLPWLGLFHKIALSDTFVHFDQVQYLPKDYMNRNKIKTTSGPIWLTVPVMRKGYRDLKTSEIQINNSMDWQKKHLKSIIFNYKNSTFFEKYIPYFEEVYSKKWNYLTELNESMLKWFLKQLGINIKFEKASDYNFEGVKSELVLNMTKKLNATHYIFGSLGKDYANENEFLNSGVKPIFQNYNHPSYSQLHGDFIPNLSILDLLFNSGPNSLEIIMSNNLRKNDIEN